MKRFGRFQFGKMPFIRPLNFPVIWYILISAACVIIIQHQLMIQLCHVYSKHKLTSIATAIFHGYESEEQIK